MSSDKVPEGSSWRDNSSDQSPTDTRSQSRLQSTAGESNSQDEHNAGNSGTVRRNRPPAIATSIGNHIQTGSLPRNAAN